MKELLGDNIVLHQRMEEVHKHGSSSTQWVTTAPTPKLREVSSPLTWADCFLSFMAVKCTNEHTRMYARLVIDIARKHGGVTVTGLHIIQALYRYTQNLVQIERASSRQTPYTLLPPPLPGILPELATWAPVLATHPDPTFARFIRERLTQGFRIGFNRAAVVLCPTHRNHKYISDNPQAVQNFLTEGCNPSTSQLGAHQPVGDHPQTSSTEQVVAYSHLVLAGGTQCQ